MILPVTQSWGEKPLGALLAWAIDHQQETKMPAKGIIQSFVVLQTPMVQPSMVNMAVTQEPKSRRQTPSSPIWISEELKSERDDSPVEDQWHSWHMRRHPGLRLLLQWYSGETNITFTASLKSTVVAEPHHAGPIFWESREVGGIVAVIVRSNAPKYKTVTGGVILTVVRKT